MEAYATALMYVTPGFIGLILIEAIIASFMGRRVNKGLDTISSLSSGMTNTLKSLIGLSVVILSYGWMVEHLAIFEIKTTWLVVLLAFIGHDFAGYWGHRFNHEINVFGIDTSSITAVKNLTWLVPFDRVFLLSLGSIFSFISRWL